MLGAGLQQFNRNRSDDRFYIPSKGRRNYLQNYNYNNNNNNNNYKNPQFHRTQSDIINGGFIGGTQFGDRNVGTYTHEPEYRFEDTPKPKPAPSLPSLSNIECFLEAVTPSILAQHFSKTTMKGLKTCELEYQAYFVFSDLWESFKEWSAYGAGVPLVLNDCDSVVQYYVPYLSGIQIFVDKPNPASKSRRTSEDSDADSCGRDSSSDGSSDLEHDRGLAYPRGQWSGYGQPSDISVKLDRLLLGDPNAVMQEGSSSDEGEFWTHQGSLYFEYFESDPPYGREPLADKISDLASRFPELKSLRSCDVLSSSWLCVAWYPIYRIPMGPTLKDLDACFLTYHHLHTPVGDAPSPQAPLVIYPSEIDGSPRISLPVFGLISYKFNGSLWISNRGSEDVVTRLSRTADRWLKVLQVTHPDYVFFSRNR